MISAKKPETISKMFDQISKRYDLVNSVLSLGVHSHWKKKLVAEGAGSFGKICCILDCATGTGDIAALWKKAYPNASQIIGLDFSAGMIECARLKHKDSGITFQLGDVQCMQLDSASFDCATISFGIRNVAQPLQALRELARVVKPQGLVLILEFGQPHIPLLSVVFRFYSRFILPKIGGLLSGKQEAYRYLSDSSAVFPCGEKFLVLAKKTDSFSTLEAKSLFGGVAWIYKLVKKE